MAATPDPLEKTHDGSSARATSKQTIPIAGILCDLYGLEELSASAKEVTCLWLLNPRLSNKARMQPMADAAIRGWEKRPGSSSRGLICVAFDQRNHGTRLVDKRANEAWRSGNPNHAQDMFSVFQGTAADTSQLINYLPAYAFPDSERFITDHIVLGVSLGGHAAWHCVLHDPRITAAVVVIGCTDYVRVMSDRARLSKLHTWTSTDPPGKTFLGSRDFPPSLLEAVDRWDPTGLLMGPMFERNVNVNQVLRDPSERELQQLLPLMRTHLAGKRILNMAGGADKLVPYKASESFLKWLKKAIAPGGWYSGRGVHLEDRIFDGVGHEFTPGMMQEAIRFISETLEGHRTGADAKI
ncbi:hypothetical protein FH972_024942 [Carpinus fangiana]|uniref:AB hydrolase-1 domain-containing protein n=1 Tax=Carpinus fangiana TaxID=176857 RepID=A0A5N6KZS1_9ROSI|nr:hypothetical protein FH972_024942 [Carpinus fangiana]